MTLTAATLSTGTDAVVRELAAARQSGALRSLEVPPCPTLLLRLRDALRGPEPDLNQVAAIAQQDVAMSAALIRLANSPLHAAGDARVTTLGQAMYRIGLDETARTLTAFALRRALPVRSAQLDRFWERSALRAAAMAFIAGQLPDLPEDLAHAHGLFCHVGVPVLLKCMPGYGGTLMEAEMRHDRSPVATENANHRTDHAVVGALVCRLWQFPPALVASVRLHHDLQVLGGDGGAEPQVRTLVAAGLVAEHLMRRHEHLPPDRDWADHAEQALSALAVPPDELQQWEDALQPRFEAALASATAP